MDYLKPISAGADRVPCESPSCHDESDESCEQPFIIFIC